MTMPKKPAPSTLSWTEILEQAKMQNTLTDAEDIFNMVKENIQLLYDQLSTYATEMAIDKSVSTLNATEIKNLVLQTRAALRFGLYCFSAAEGAQQKDAVPLIQALAVIECQWHMPLVALLSCRRGDSNCRTLSSRLLSNLVTCNSQTASKLASDLALSPSQSKVDASIRESITKIGDTSTIDEHEGDSLIYTAQIEEPNWVDMILNAATSGNREALAAIAAALHNLVSSLVVCDENGLAVRYEFAEAVASNSLLVSTLLRNFVSARVLQNSISNEKQSGIEAESEKVDLWDSASDWIQLLLSKLSNLGLLPEMFTSIFGGKGNDKLSTEIYAQLLPEQSVLLHCMEREADSFVLKFDSNCETKNPFGGESGLETTISNYSFLCALYVNFSPCLHPMHSPKESSEEIWLDTSLIRSGLVTVSDILGASLGIDNSSNTTLRLKIGEGTVVLQEAVKSLGTTLDELAQRSAGRRAREIHLEQGTQTLLISSVRLIGNLCFRCPHNQNLLRTTLVPSRTSSQSQREELDAQIHELNSGEGLPLRRDGVPRNGLHVLLSCTSYATSCFTLREWAVIAIRNALEENLENQELVAELDAQDPVQSADLENAGVRVQLDSKGKVTLKKLDNRAVPIIQEEADDAGRT